MSLPDPWNLWVRDSAGHRAALITKPDQFAATLNVNDVDVWALTLFRSDPVVDMLIDPGAAIQLLYGTEPVCTGPMLNWVRKYDSSGDFVTISGVSWDTWLGWRLTHPQPATTAPPYNADAYDVFVDTAEAAIIHYVNVNCGPGAIARRQVPGLGAMPTNLGRGATVLGLGRWDTVLSTIQPFADNNGLYFKLVEDPNSVTPAFYLVVDEPADLTLTARFSPGLNNLQSFEYGLAAPTADYAYVGGQDAGTSRPIEEVEDSAAVTKWFGSPIETFVNASDTTDGPTMVQEGEQQLTTMGEQPDYKLTPVSDGPIQFMRDWALGDIVSVLIDNVAVPNTIRSVAVTIDNTGVKAVPSIQSPSSGSALVSHDEHVSVLIDKLHRRLRNIERS